MLKTKILFIITLPLFYVHLVLAAPLESTSYGNSNWQMALAGELFRSQQNYGDTLGSLETLGGDSYYQLFRTQGRVRREFFDGIGLSAQMSFHAAEAQNPSSVRTHQNLGPWNLGIDFSLIEGKSRMFAYMDVSGRMVGINFLNPSDNKPLVSDDTYAIAPGLGAEFALFNLAWMARAQPVFRTGDMSQLLQYYIHARALWLRWGVGGLVRGSHTLIADNQPSREAVNDQSSAGSLYFNAVNPTLIQTEAWVEYRLDSQLNLLVGAGHTLAGMNSAFGPNIFAKLEFGFASMLEKSSRKTDYLKILKERRALSKRNLRSFKPEKAKELDNYFDADDPSLESMESQLDQIEKELN